VNGTVTLDGTPVDGGRDLYGTVSFCRDDGGGAPAVGIIKSAGRYELSTGAREGLEPGKYMVAVSVKKILPPAAPGGLTRPQQLSPDVKPGNNRLDFAVTSEPNK
jgi:hypothetical protein